MGNKFSITQLLTGIALVLALVQPVSALPIPIMDTLTGNSYGDGRGGSRNVRAFDVGASTVDRIRTVHPGKRGSDTLASSAKVSRKATDKHGKGAGYGSLFLNSALDPFETSSDDYIKGKRHNDARRSHDLLRGDHQRNSERSNRTKPGDCLGDRKHGCGNNVVASSVSVASVPEPSVLMLLAAGLIGVVAVNRKRRAKITT